MIRGGYLQVEKIKGLPKRPVKSAGNKTRRERAKKKKKICTRQASPGTRLG